MPKLLDEIKHDVSFIRSHTLQPQWYKVLKVFILLGAVAGYYFMFGWFKTLLFFALFFSLSLVVHLVYRTKTSRWTRSWLDFVVVEENGEVRPKSIGVIYYMAVVINAIVALVFSQTAG